MKKSASNSNYSIEGAILQSSNVSNQDRGEDYEQNHSFYINQYGGQSNHHYIIDDENIQNQSSLTSMRKDSALQTMTNDDSLIPDEQCEIDLQRTDYFVNKKPHQIVRTTVISSDSMDPQIIRNSNIKPTFLMNRLNWITYLKILYDQLEKIQVAVPQPQKSFLSINTNRSSKMSSRGKKPAAPKLVTIEKVSRDQLVKAIQKVMNLLPLLSLKEYKIKHPQEQGITFQQVVNQFMSSQFREFTWDNIIDLLLMMSMQNQENSVSEILKKSESGNTEIFGTISQLSQIKKDQDSNWGGGYIDKPFYIKLKAQGNKTGGATTPKENLAIAPEEVKSTFSYQVKNQINNNFSDQQNSFKQKDSDGGKLSDIQDSSSEEQKVESPKIWSKKSIRKSQEQNSSRLSFGKDKLKQSVNLKSVQNFDESQMEQLNVEDIDEFPQAEVPQEQSQERAPRETTFQRMIGRNYEIVNSRNINNDEGKNNIMGLMGYYSQQQTNQSNFVNFTGSQRINLLNCQNVQILSVQKCNLETLQPILNSCKLLKYLNASNNNLREISKQMLPMCLTELILANNKLQNVTLKFERKKKLHILDISLNQIKNIANFLNRNFNLKIEYLCYEGSVNGVFLQNTKILKPDQVILNSKLNEKVIFEFYGQKKGNNGIHKKCNTLMYSSGIQSLNSASPIPVGLKALSMSSYHHQGEPTNTSSPQKKLVTKKSVTPISSMKQSFTLQRRLKQLLHPAKHKKGGSDQIPLKYQNMGVQLPNSPRVLSKKDKDRSKPEDVTEIEQKIYMPQKKLKSEYLKKFLM